MYDIVVDMQSFYMYCERECLVCCISLIGFCENFGLCIKVVLPLFDKVLKYTPVPPNSSWWTEQVGRCNNRFEMWYGI